MPYSAEHKQHSRERIVEAARILFNRHGFEAVTIDQVMEQAGLTRGGFYNHFKTKKALYAEAVDSFLMGRGKQWRNEAGITPTCPHNEMASRMLDSYLSNEHLKKVDDQCPMIALPSDVARAGPEVREAYQKSLEAMVYLYSQSIENGPDKRQKALSLAALSVGGMILARTLPDSDLAEDVQSAARVAADAILNTL